MCGDRDIFPCGCTDFARAALTVHQPRFDTAADDHRHRRPYQRTDDHTAPKRHALARADADLHADRHPDANAHADLWRACAANLDSAHRHRDTRGEVYNYRQQERQPAEWAINR